MTTSSPTPDLRVADAAPHNWVDTLAPAAWRPYLRLARADRPIGWWLLLLPCWWSVGLAAVAQGQALPNLWHLFLFFVGAVVMRGAGCTYNDIVDRDIDTEVTRTQSRPIPSGQVSAKSAAVFMVALSLIGLVVLLQFNWFSVQLGIASLLVVAAYPFMKRITHWPQAVLGLAFSWGALMGWAGAFGSLDWPALVLYVGTVAWVVGYDTIYAHQDREDDAMIGLGSTALKFGEQTVAWLIWFFLFAWACILIAGCLAGGGLVFVAGMHLVLVHFLWQIMTLDINDGANCLVRFKSNRDAGLLVFAALVADGMVQAL